MFYHCRTPEPYIVISRFEIIIFFFTTLYTHILRLGD